MSAAFELTAELRSDLGKGASRRLRHSEKVPGIMYGASQEATPLTFDHNQLLQALKHEAFYSHILTIVVDGTKHKAVLKDLHRHPYKPRVLHVDLLRITGKEKITMHVPLHFLGESQAPGVKQGGIASHQMTSLEVRCLPADLPEYIEVDISNLALDAAIHISDLKLPKGVESIALMHGDDLSVASIHMPRAVLIEEETGAPVAPAAPEAIKQTSDKDKPEGSA